MRKDRRAAVIVAVTCGALIFLILFFMAIVVAVKPPKPVVVQYAPPSTPLPPTPEPTPWPTPEPVKAQIVRIDDFVWRMFIPNDWTDTGVDVFFGQNISIEPTYKSEGVHRFILRLGNKEFFSRCETVSAFGHFDLLKIAFGKYDWRPELLHEPHGFAGSQERLYLKAHQDMPNGIWLLVTVRPCVGWETCNIPGRVVQENGEIRFVDHP